MSKREQLLTGMKPYHFKQEGEYDCWTACAKMIIDYWNRTGERIDYTELQTKAKDMPKDDQGTTNGTMQLCINNSGNSESFVCEAKLLFDGDNDWKQAKLLIERSLDQGYPVVLGMQRERGDGGKEAAAHAVVLHGYNEKNAYILDPWIADGAVTVPAYCYSKRCIAIEDRHYSIVQYSCIKTKEVN